MKRITKMFVFLALLIICISYSSNISYASDTSSKTIRVGYPIQKGLSMVDDDGNLYGYTYDYLMEISQYTGWEYDFVILDGYDNEQLLKALEMLKKGELDILGGFNYDEAYLDVLSYSGYSYGTNYTGIFVPNDSELTESTLHLADEIKVAIYSKTLNKNVKLEQYADMNNLKIKQVVTDSYEKYKNMIKNHTADAMLSSDLAVDSYENMRAIAHYSPIPFYFVTTKGNTEIVRQVDYALSTINQVNPNFMTQLYNHYFANPSNFHLTGSEKEFIKNNDTLEVVIYDNKPPYQYIDTKTGKIKGITIELLEKISKLTGLQFHYNTVSTYKDYIAFINNGKADIAGDALLSFQDSKIMKSTLTLPWHSLPVYMVFKKEHAIKKNSRCAIPYFLKNQIPIKKNVTYYDSVEQCLNAIQSGKADYGYIGEFCGQYFLNLAKYSNLKFSNQQDSLEQKLCFGIVNKDNLYLLSIFNKCITSLSGDKIDEIIYRNTYKKQAWSFSVWLKDNITFIIIIFLIILLVITLFYFYSRNRKEIKIAFENRKYITLSNLVNEFFYEYDVLADELTLSEKCANYFSCSTKITMFSKKLSDIPEQEQYGIWQLASCIIDSKKESNEVSCQMDDKTRQWFEITPCIFETRKKHPYIIGKIVNIQDIKSKQIHLEQKASIDGLTGIYNTTAMKRLIYEHIKSFDSSAPCAFIILDVDNFKHVNDKYGHYNGDAVLVQIANLISSIFNPNLTGRLGGDEFIIFTENLNLDELEKCCNILLKDVAQKTNSMLGIAITLSIGITIVKKGQTYEDLYKEADNALYQTKRNKKNGYTIYT